MNARGLSFVAPRSVAVRTEPVPEPDPDELRVRTTVSAISAGTEGLLYRGEAPADLEADAELDALEGDLSYPLSYGYAAVGTVIAVGDRVSGDWLDRQVFAYNPHESHFCARPEDVLAVPESITPREAALFATLETAATFVLDGRPLLGERVAVFGQGVVGLLTTALLARFPLEELVVFDRYERRRELAESFGADRALDPDAGDADDRFAEIAGGRADLTYELSGNPDALDDAIATTGFDGRVIVGSWYGTKPTTVDLGGRFHRNRIDVRSSQVSTIAPDLSGRWDRRRRHETTWDRLRELELVRLISHEFPLEDATKAYERLENRPGSTIQVLLTYE
ncbi:zinc-dependent alcohol dehydrogenase [Natronococcus occultus]|uniref:Theronine dehydrogenase-like Zn-dependent dehydrogenase n=1 Tax=Natronococcus occultus SP4 TaxID=694430 RepID=L0JXG1_9EURY|nr:zinc-binding alcohol dehydrogenase [Natronococcus occultus]AGB37446.1 theronine dehydrogenase-like Zn-dependent dehydrogenase [Natronococcus occultus SP4]